MSLKPKRIAWRPFLAALILAAGCSKPGEAGAATFVSDTYVGSQLGHFQYFGRWEHVRRFHDRRFFGSSSRTATVGSKVSLSFVGRVVRVYGVRGRGGAYGSLTLDGKRYPDIDFYDATVIARAVVFSSPVLRKGKHMLVIAAIGNRNAPGRRNTYINLSGAVYE